MTFGPIRFSIATWAGIPTDPDPTAVKTIPPLIRRRITAMGRRALGAACRLPETDRARIVFSSRHGEFYRTLAILTAMAGEEPLSPTDFSMSVHHALASLLAIAKGNHAGHSAIAAGAESFCFGLVEALGCLAEKPEDPVLLIHSDEPLPDGYAVFNSPGDAPISLALLLTARGPEEFSLTATPATNEPPCAPATVFLNFLQSSDLNGRCNGETAHWQWVRHGAR